MENMELSDASVSSSELPDSTVDESQSRKRFISSSSDEDDDCDLAKRKCEEDRVVSESANRLLETLSSEPAIPSSEQGVTENSSGAAKEEEVKSPSIAAIWKLCCVASSQLQETPEMSAIQRPGHVIMSSILGLDVKTETGNVEQKTVMLETAKATVYGILDHCLNEILFEACPGCQIFAGNQMSHECVLWNNKFLSKKLKDICGNLCFINTLHILLLIGYCQNSLYMTSEILDYIMNLVTYIGQTDKAIKVLNAGLKSCNQEILQQVKTVLKNRPYKHYVKFWPIITNFKKE
ncbi:uncharacterized protein LOC134297943 [Anolis carolinensis]|uniref:uncharacterized protein LOC103278345 n=1 Tax=Anolis carolinensis TaxID=28377 RepID=UPI00020394A2|nr:PREDICTED: uncharacterized protein LOC100558607 [Anolis carolinensis]XP_003228654.1 PREDICTED: uncharacterized protein LOC100566133 [Anolis carolinensis]XP_008108323.1 PREDICTED: uncharacterized protein LOC103278776 [Anolis carolinensis]|eukprot:XP_003221491.1 PREDICTED: uncharacterized protein LOC100558607 [Anolis carolinensis]